jgi:N-methylhydantoinase B
MAVLKPFGVAHSHLPEPRVYRAPYTLQDPPLEVDPITYEIIKHRLWYVGLTLGETLKKVSGTIVTAEANDMSSYITLENGAPVFLGPYVIFHSGIADLIVSNVIELNREEPGIRDGDMFFVNDPWLGPAHQCDCAIVAPLFVDGEIYAWTGLTVHQLDMGGVDPGGLCPHARDVYAEPTIYPAVKIVDQGHFRTDFDRLLQRNSRMPGILALDIRSMIAGNYAARRDLLKLVDQYGKDVVKSVMVVMLHKTSEMFRARLKQLPIGIFRSRDWNEIGGAAPELQDEVYEVECALTNTGEKLVFDFTGTSPQCRGFANCGIGGMRSGVIAGFMEPIAFDIPWNAGILVNIEIISQEGTVNNPTYPAAVSDGITEGAIVTAAASSGAVSQMLLGSKEFRERALITSGSNFLGNTLGGMDERGQRWGTLLMDVIGMTAAPTAVDDAKDITGSGGIPYTQFSNVETNELHYPMLYFYRRLGRDSWGHGYRRGGRAIELAFKPHRTGAIYMLLWNHGAEFPNTGGIAGGLSASAVRFKLARGTPIEDLFKEGKIPHSIDQFECTPLAAKSENLVFPADIVYFGVPGTAGYGDPVRREPERVLADVQAGILTVPEARRFYGVVLSDDGRRVDQAATEEERVRVNEQRLLCGRFPDEWERMVPPEEEEVRSSRPEKRPAGDGWRELFRVGMGIKVMRDHEGKVWFACTECGHLYGPTDEDPKSRSLLRIGRLNDFSHPTAQMTRAETPRFFHRQFYCPGCGLMWTNELARADDPILRQFDYDPQWLASL